MSLSDLRSALAARDLFVSIAEEVVTRLRPEQRIGKVFSYTAESQTALVLLPGETIASLVVARFPADRVPTTQMSTTYDTLGYDAPGDIVRVAGKPGSYYIADYVSGSPESVNGLRIGHISKWPTSTPPANHLLCNGGSFSALTFPALAAYLGDTYGTHSGNTYYLPYITEVPQDTGWINVSYLNGWFTYGAPNWAPLSVRRVNGIVYQRGMVQNNDSSGANLGQPVGILPVGFRPQYTNYIMSTSGGGPRHIVIQSNGTVAFEGNTFWGTWLSAVCSFPADGATSPINHIIRAA